MTSYEAAQLVIQAGAMAKGGEVFVLEMGEPVRISDMANEMIKLSGLTVKSQENPEGDIDILFTGLRPGEKLYEELLIENNCLGTEHPRIMRAEETHYNWAEIQELIKYLDQCCEEQNYSNLHDAIMQSPSAFKPLHGIDDLVYCQDQSRPKLIVVND